MPKYKSTVVVTTAVGLVALAPKNGTIGYAEDEALHYLYYGNTWYKIIDIIAAITTGFIDTDSAMAANSDTKIASQKATKAALAAKAATVHTHAISDVTNLQTSLNEKLMFYLAGTLKSNAKMLVVTATTSSGNVVFNLTTNNSPTGTALFTNVYLDAIQVEAYSTGAVLLFGAPTLAGDKKTISFPVNQVTAVLLGLLNIVTASNGITARLMIVGD